MSCAIEDCYIGQFPLKLCQVTVIVKRHSKSRGICVCYTAWKTSESSISLSLPPCRLRSSPETGSQVASNPLCRWGLPALACWSLCLCLPNDRIMGVSHQAKLHFLSSVPQDLVPSSAKFAILISHQCLIVHCSDGWVLESNVIFFDGCNLSPQNFCYLLDHRMSHTPWKFTSTLEAATRQPSLSLTDELFSFTVNCMTDSESLLFEWGKICDVAQAGLNLELPSLPYLPKSGDPRASQHSWLHSGMPFLVHHVHYHLQFNQWGKSRAL